MAQKASPKAAGATAERSAVRNGVRRALQAAARDARQADLLILTDALRKPEAGSGTGAGTGAGTGEPPAEASVSPLLLSDPVGPESDTAAPATESEIMPEPAASDAASDTAETTAEAVASPEVEALAALERLGEDEGYFQPLGAGHSALFCDDGPVLLVSFETLSSIMAAPGGQPLARQIAKAQGWSCLVLIAHGDDWYRSEPVFRFFDRQVDDAFFEDFDRVVFYGAGKAGYAAASYSVTAPGATVILCAPQATLDPRITGWDRRFRQARRGDFTSRYGFAPDMVEGAGTVYVIYDPLEALDAMHAALFTRPFVHQLACRLIGHDPAQTLSDMDLLKPVLSAACRGEFDASVFWSMYRHGRRHYGPWIRGFAHNLEQMGRRARAAMVLRSAAHTLKSRRMRRQAAAMIEDLAASGITLPAPLHADEPESGRDSKKQKKG